MSEKLLPCPFCGGDCRLHYYKKDLLRGDMVWVGCKECDAESQTYYSNAKAAIKNWNRRYAGMNDESGTPIYTGDIVEFFGQRGEIVLENGVYGIFTPKNIDYDTLEEEIPYSNPPHFLYNDRFISLLELWCNYQQDDEPLYCVCVIGNKWDNKEHCEHNFEQVVRGMPAALKNTNCTEE